jgi:hypothetical protein
MEQELVLMVGSLRGEVLANEDWNAQVATLRREATPVVALQCDPLPVILLETAQAPQVRALIRPWQAEEAVPAQWAVWCTVLTPDLGLAESFLLVSRVAPRPGRWMLHFPLPYQQAVLEAIERTGTLGLVAEPEAAVVWMPVPTSELRAHLDQLHRFQHGEGEEGAPCTN